MAIRSRTTASKISSELPEDVQRKTLILLEFIDYCCETHNLSVNGLDTQFLPEKRSNLSQTVSHWAKQGVRRRIKDRTLEFLVLIDPDKRDITTLGKALFPSEEETINRLQCQIEALELALASLNA